MKNVAPFFSAAETLPGEGFWDVGDHRLQLDFWPFNHKPPATVLRRQGVPFWDYLDAAGIPSTFYDLAVELSAQPFAAWPSSLHLRNGHSRHARRLRHVSALQRRHARRRASKKGAASDQSRHSMAIRPERSSLVPKIAC